MPFNCPIGCYVYPDELSCDDCHHCEEKFGEPYCTIERKPIKEILSPDERIDRLERLIKKLQEALGEQAIPDRVWYKRLGQVEGRLVHIDNKLNDHIDSSRKKRGERYQFTSVTKEKE